MKVKSLCLLAGATAAFVCASAMADHGITWTVNGGTHPSVGLNFEESVSGGLQTVTISVTGVGAGNVALGLLITASPGPFFMNTTDPDGFYNNNAFPGAALANFADSQDSGFMGPEWAAFGGFSSAWGSPPAVASGWATTGVNVSSTGPQFWGVLDGATWDTDGSNIPILRATWGELEEASGAFLFAVADPIDGVDEFYFEWFVPAIPAPGALALLGIAGLIGVRRRRA